MSTILSKTKKAFAAALDGLIYVDNIPASSQLKSVLDLAETLNENDQLTLAGYLEDNYPIHFSFSQSFVNISHQLAKDFTPVFAEQKECIDRLFALEKSSHKYTLLPVFAYTLYYINGDMLKAAFVRRVQLALNAA